MTGLERVLNKVEMVTESGCWIWTGTTNPNGYGRVTDRHIVPGRRTFAVHRYVYECAKGPIPKGLQIDHLCRVRCCVNPDHLEAVTHRINLLRGIGRTAINASATQCPRGHVYDSANTYIHKGSRFCRKCRVIATSAARRKRVARLKVIPVSQP